MKLFGGRLELEGEGKAGLRELLRSPGVSAGQGGDEYGNPTLYVRCAAFTVVWWYPTGRYQVKVEIPEYGTCAWTDHVFYEEPAEEEE